MISTPREFAERIERECYRGVATVNTICSSFATSKCAELVAARDAELAPKPVTGQTFEEWWEKDGKCYYGIKDACACAWNAALASKEAEIAELRSPGPCGKHPKMFWKWNFDVVEGHKLVCADPSCGYCTLCAELASAKARIDAAMKLADELRKKSVSAREDRIAYELIRALGRKVEP